MSRNDIWQPEQPSSHTVAIRALLISSPRAKPVFARVGADAPSAPRSAATRDILTLIARFARNPGRGVRGYTNVRRYTIFHSFSFRINVRYGRNWRRFIISATERPFSNSAPVGQTCTHFPQVVQVSDDPHGSFKSVMTLASMPRPITSQVCAPSISSQTRTQRVHRMQRL